uniref:Uncharacterized protein n=1 Tax=Anguilla anguilla TaxID=7936 RepID=A0A0E9USY7_ANGAN
MDLECLSD